jgi:glyoxylase-like metal-dependent hydrolase (beta-lactamase superfamily II)
MVNTVKAGDEVLDRGKILALPGHAPGQVGLEIGVGTGEHLLFCGDAIHSPLQVFQPAWSSALCHDRGLAAETRQTLLERAAADGLRLVPSHLRGASMHVRERNGHFVPSFEH